MADLRRRRMGKVFQHFALPPNRTVVGTVAFPLEVQATPRAGAERRVAKVVRVSSLMTAAENGTASTGVRADATISDIAPELVSAEGPMPVLFGGRQVGWLDPSTALATLAART
ncbi:hypothetical protein AB3G45_00055 [Shinella sp. S4-D37]|uniref:hypothetical protein n=1 Tax=Shinella sp. S4-D37 TaxID=3161999 RepID=UPI003466B7BE